MKNKLTSLITIVAITAMGASAAMAGPGIKNTAHDIGNYLNGKGSTLHPTETRICAGCHTPHHSLTPDLLTGISNTPEYTPLWAHAVDLNYYDAYANPVYNARTDTLRADDTLIGPSRLCMSCHDGVIAVDSYYQPATGVSAFTDNQGSVKMGGGNDFGGNNIGIGAGGVGTFSMARNHPIGFDFKAFAADNLRTLGGFQSNVATTKTYVNNAQNITVASRLYDDGTGAGYMTCATCHDVHNKKTPDNEGPGTGTAQFYFTLAPQAGSALCITCHTQAGTN